jgi:glycine cleavage system aminomethyltransferase T
MSPPVLSLSRRIRSTPFSAQVEACGVKAYTVYNSMLLPTVFRSIEEDYWHLRRHVQLWDVSCERQVELHGPDAARLMQLMTPRDLGRVAIGQCAYCPLVDEAGGMINDPVVLKLAEDRFWLSIASSDVLLWAKGLALGFGFDVAVHEPGVSPLAVQGPKAEELMARVFGEAVRAIAFFRFDRLAFEGQPFVVARSGWSKQGGFEIYLDAPELGGALWEALWQAGDGFDAARMQQLACDIGRAGTIDVGQDQHAVAAVCPVEHLARERNEVERIVLTRHAQLGDTVRTFVQHMAGALQQRFAKSAVSDEKNSDHGRRISPCDDCSRDIGTALHLNRCDRRTT